MSKRRVVPLAIAVLCASCLGGQLDAAQPAGVAVGPQYDSTHAYVAPDDFDRFVASLIATFGGTASRQGVLQITPTPSQTMSQIALMPVGIVSVFGFKTPVPYPENRIYVSPDRADAFVRSFVRFSHGKVESDHSRAPGTEIGRPTDTYRRIRIESTFGRITLFVTDGHLPYPYGRELTGYEVVNLDETLDNAKAAAVTVLVEPRELQDRRSAIVQFPGGYIAEIHTPLTH